MRKIIAVVVMALLIGCTSNTEFGPCIGAFDDRDQKLIYKVSVWNTFVAIIFIETIIVPVWVVVEEAQCPIARKP